MKFSKLHQNIVQTQDVMKAVDREMALRDQISRQAELSTTPAHEPSDEELISLAGEERFLLTSWEGEERIFLFCDQDEFLDIARAILARYGSKLI